MKLSQILKNVNVKNEYIDMEIESLSMNTNDNLNNSLFFCLKGEKIDSHNLVDLIISKGAKAIVVERKLDLDFPQILVENTRKIVGICAENFYDNPCKKLKLVGITGTNGKTTTTYMIKNILEFAGQRVGIIGTNGIVIGEKKFPNPLTTPDPIELHRILGMMVEEKIDVVAMEVSAHAIALNKIAGMRFDVGVLTNITQDHLDYFKTFSNYAKTKLKFLSKDYCSQIVVNIDDKMGQNLALNNSDIRVKTFGLNNPSDCFATNIKYSLNGTTFFLNDEDNLNAINTRLIGEFNVYNAMCASAVCSLLGVTEQAIKSGLSSMQFVDGRNNVYKLNNGAYAVIDYAHTPDGLENILLAMRRITKGRLICLFGCGGNRDASKRPIMGEISGKLADFTVLTTDNPRFEDADDIIRQIEVGIKKQTTNYKCLTDRKQAINYCMSKLRKNDLLIIAGKGAENYLDIKGEKIPYSDLEVLKNENRNLLLGACK